MQKRMQAYTLGKPALENRLRMSNQRTQEETKEGEVLLKPREDGDFKRENWLTGSCCRENKTKPESVHWG